MDAQGLVDRRRLRRKLAFWRSATLLGLAIVAIGLAVSGLPRAKDRDHIARISVSGIVLDDDKLISLIEEIGENEAAKALVVAISTPGGTTYGGERIHTALRAVAKRKPVVAEIRTLAASAGYMIAASTDHIVAGKSSIVGSIGVIFEYAQMQELMDKIGVRFEAIKSAPLKAEPSPFHEASPEAKAMIRSLILDSYDWFIDLVAEGRDMDRSRIEALADGSIFTGRQGLENGLVDELGGEAEVRDYLATRDVDASLEMILWEPASATESLILPEIGALIFERVTGIPAGLLKGIRHLGTGQLFLDGLLSVWQFGGNGDGETKG